MSTASFLLDTSFILALLNPFDVLHNQAQERLLSLEVDIINFEIPLICAIETLIRNPYPVEFTTLLSELIGHRDFELTSTADLNYIAELPLKTRTVLKANDCSVIAISKRLKAELLTFDKRLLKAYANVSNRRVEILDRNESAVVRESIAEIESGKRKGYNNIDDLLKDLNKG